MLVQKRETILSILIVVLLALTFSLEYGCGGGYDAENATGTRAIGTTDTAGIASRTLPKNSYFAALASKVLAAATKEGDTGGDAQYDALLTPQGYSVGLQRVQMLLTTDPSTSPSYTVFDTGDVSSPKVVDLVTGYEGTFGENATYPAAGTYDRERYILVYCELTLPADGVVGTYRLYMSTVGSYQRGDVRYNDNGTWKWIDSTDGSYDTTRPASPVVLDLSGQPDPYEETVNLTSSFTVPADPTGLYTVTVTFDVTNCFFWDDRDGDGLFEPAGDDWQTAPSLDTSGFDFWPGPPAQTVTVTQS
ncbi:MAG: hypothetical protein ABID54_09665 [Pseudomonadota bacterium]